MIIKDEGLQQRFTFEDCIKSQHDLRKMLSLLMFEKRPLHPKEKQLYFRTFAKALLSQGTNECFTFVIHDGWFTFESYQTFAIRMGYLTTPYVKLTTTRPDEVAVVVKIEKLWDILDKKSVYYFPKAYAQAINMSAEVIHKEQQAPAKFSSKNEIQKEVDKL
jgi:hypothetical protein